MTEPHGDRRTSLDRERGHLHSQISELTQGGDADLGFDDDFADRGQVASEQGENRALADMLQAQLSLVDRALVRLDDGSYGTCAVCGEAISSDRLDAIPATDRCIEHA